jgi:hypothetical protein
MADFADGITEERAVPGAVPCNGSLITRSLMRTPRSASLAATQIPSSPEPGPRRDQRAVMRPARQSVPLETAPGLPGNVPWYGSAMEPAIVTERVAGGQGGSTHPCPICAAVYFCWWSVLAVR